MLSAEKEKIILDFGFAFNKTADNLFNEFLPRMTNAKFTGDEMTSTLTGALVLRCSEIIALAPEEYRDIATECCIEQLKGTLYGEKTKSRLENLRKSVQAKRDEKH